MKRQKQPGVTYFGPRLRIPLKEGSRSVRKPRTHARFASKAMKKIQKDVAKWRANIQFVLGNGRNRKDIGPNKAYGRNKKISPSMIINKPRKSNYSEKDQQGNNVLPQSKQHLDGGKVGHRNPDAMKEDFPPIATSPKSTLMSSMTSKIKQRLVQHANDVKMPSLQPKKLNAMPGLVLKSKGRHRPLTLMHSGDKMDDSNDITNDDDNLRNKEEPLSEENPQSHGDNGSEGENPNCRTMKRRRKYIETNEDEDGIGDRCPEGVADDSIRLTSEDDILKDRHDRVSVPFVGDGLEKQCYCCSKPIEEPVWSGLLNIGDKEYVPLSGHLSSKSCEKVHNLSKSLPCVVEVAKLPRSKVWPMRWQGSRPTNDNIGLYILPRKMRPDKSHDKILKELMQNDLALRAFIDDAEMLIFPSSLLPKRYQMFQMNYYLWGVFKPREVEGKQGAAHHQPDCTTGATTFAANATATRVATEAAIIPPGATGVATDATSIPSEVATNAPTGPANHGQTDLSSIGAPPARMFAFVVQQQTPRLEQLIREMQQEGALVMQGEMMSTGSWPGNMATATQPAQPSKT